MNTVDLKISRKKKRYLFQCNGSDTIHTNGSGDPAFISFYKVYDPPFKGTVPSGFLPQLLQLLTTPQNVAVFHVNQRTLVDDLQVTPLKTNTHQSKQAMHSQLFGLCPHRIGSASGDPRLEVPLQLVANDSKLPPARSNRWHFAAMAGGPAGQTLLASRHPER